MKRFNSCKDRENWTISLRDGKIDSPERSLARKLNLNSSRDLSGLS